LETPKSDLSKSAHSAIESSGRVLGWTEKIILPTYVVGPPETTPLFYDGRQSQHAQAHFYPYPAIDKLSDVKRDAAYDALCLENEYIKVVVLPEIGGRLFSATDKTNGYEFIYRQSVIKPSNISITGAWISGGIEWNFPHHHRASNFMTVDHCLVENADGSATIWVGEIERRHRMKWLVGITLRPGSSAVEVTVRLVNRAPVVQSALYWACAAVHTNENYQYIFPPSAKVVTWHCKNAFSHWPVSHEADFAGVDLRGIDLSWWKNHPAPGSYFIHNLQEDFHGGYDHGKHAGTMHVADHHTVNCAKLFEWGNCPEAEVENSKLTDTDGHYAELMVGAFSDNQPDYSWMEPHQYREFTHCWYPLREIGVAKNANAEAAVNLETAGDGRARVVLNTTRRHHAARLIVRCTEGQATIVDQKIDVAPDLPFILEFDLPDGREASEFSVLIDSADGRELIAYTPERPAQLPELPAPVTQPDKPELVGTIEELVQIAVRLDQFHNPVLSPYLYLEEALRRDPEYAPANAFLGILQCKRLLFVEAEASLGRALARLEQRYTQPRKGEVYYYLGLALAGQGRDSEAAERFHRAAWYSEWHSVANLRLAQISARGNDFAQALRFVDEALVEGGRDCVAIELRVILLRVLGRGDDHALEIARLRALDPLNAVAVGEQFFADPKSASELIDLLRIEPANWLELASVYLSVGRWDDALHLLDIAVSSMELAEHPMIQYYIGHFQARKGDVAAAKESRRRAAALPVDGCFPYGQESWQVLRDAVADEPCDAHAWLYLGNLLYNHKPEQAMAAWTRAAAAEPGLALAKRNLAFGYRRSKQPKLAIDFLGQALQIDHSNPRWIEEFDALLAQVGEDPKRRLETLRSFSTVVENNPNTRFRIVLASLVAGDPDTAIDILESTRFFNYEARRDKYEAFAMAHLLRGDRLLREGRFDAARQDYQAALTYPINLESGKPYHDDLGAHIFYKLGLVSKAEGETAVAFSWFERSAASRNPLPWSDRNYYQGMALRCLGREEDAVVQFEGLISAGTARFTDGRWYNFFAGYQEEESVESQKSTAHFEIGLGRLGLGDPSGARNEFRQAIQFNPCNLWAVNFLAYACDEVKQS
jgi:tetratricopeptide (TPR) repeat protein